jgi:hypothetical protein
MLLEKSGRQSALMHLARQTTSDLATQRMIRSTEPGIASI